jgi:hypothetical protein
MVFMGAFGWSFEAAFSLKKTKVKQRVETRSWFFRNSHFLTVQL